jgi:hypothetical protein
MIPKKKTPSCLSYWTINPSPSLGSTFPTNKKEEHI